MIKPLSMATMSKCLMVTYDYGVHDYHESVFMVTCGSYGANGHHESIFVMTYDSFGC